MTKDEMIETLITSDLSDWFSYEEKDAYFAMHLRDGFIGYINQSEQELKEECLARDLIELKSNYPDCKMCGIENYVCFVCKQSQLEKI